MAFENNSDPIHEYKRDMAAKPVADFFTLCDALQVSGTKIIVQPNKVIHKKDALTISSVVCLIVSGEFSLVRTSDHLIIHEGSAPSMWGLASCFFNHEDFDHLVAQSECHCVFVPAYKALEIIGQQNLWKETATILAWLVNTLKVHHSQMLNVSTYSMVRSKLLDLIELPEEKRKFINTAKFIMQRTLISRSMVMRILSDLRKGGYIRIDDGKLLELKQLPLYY